MFQLVEIFESIKGEGTQTGIPMLFVRFSKCNLSCSWCDTPYNDVNMRLSHDELLQKIVASNCKWVCFTGGEPTLQLTKELVIDCHNNHKLTSIETNGIYWNDVIKNITYVTVSPKLGHPVCPAVASCLIDEVRYTIDEDTTDLWDCTTGRPCNSIKNLWPYFVTGITAAAVCISPIFNNTAPPTPNKKALETSLALVNKYAPVARLSLQVHKFIGVR